MGESCDLGIAKNRNGECSRRANTRARPVCAVIESRSVGWAVDERLGLRVTGETAFTATRLGITVPAARRMMLEL